MPRPVCFAIVRKAKFCSSDALSFATTTTVGYGDKVPVGYWGKLVGAACAITGVLTLVMAHAATTRLHQLPTGTISS